MPDWLPHGEYPNPVPFCDFVTTTTHKTLREPRGGVILCRDNTHEKALNSSIFPSLQGGPLMHVIAAKAVAFKEALQPEFKQYAKQVKINAAVMAEELVKRGLRIVLPHRKPRFPRRPATDENHRQSRRSRFGQSAHHRQQKRHPERSGKTVRYLRHPHGSAAMTTRGFNETDARVLSNLVADVLANPEDEANLAKVRGQVTALCDKYPVYGN